MASFTTNAGYCYVKDKFRVAQLTSMTLETVLSHLGSWRAQMQMEAEPVADNVVNLDDSTSSCRGNDVDR